MLLVPIHVASIPYENDKNVRQKVRHKTEERDGKGKGKGEREREREDYLAGSLALIAASRKLIFHSLPVVTILTNSFKNEIRVHVKFLLLSS